MTIELFGRIHLSLRQHYKILTRAIRLETDAGHGAGTPISKAIKQAADRYSFACYNMGIIPDLAKKDM